MVPLQTHGCYNIVAVIRMRPVAVVPLQTHGCYNFSPSTVATPIAVVPLQTHGCYNLSSWNPAWRSCLLAHVLSRLGPFPFHFREAVREAYLVATQSQHDHLLGSQILLGRASSD